MWQNDNLTLFMTYNEIVTYLYNQLPYYQRDGKKAYKVDLNNTLELDKWFKYPHRGFKSIHVAGTNGKGSVSHMMSSILQQAGYKTGLYTSPHLKDFRERIKINGQCISKEDVVDFVLSNKLFFEELKPSFFELTVAMAFYFFKKHEVDFAVIETGLGGRLDSTNIITPELSIITNISYDHTDLLGDSLTDIAFEKAGIIKQNVPVVIGERSDATDDVFITTSREKGSSISFADKVYRSDYALYSMHDTQVLNIYKNEDLVYDKLEVDLMGEYQLGNVHIVLTAIDILLEKGLKIEKEHIYDGLKSVRKTTGLNGRWQIIGYNPKVILDIAHNVESIKSVVRQLENTPCKKLFMVVGFVNDKDIFSILEILPKEVNYYFTKAQIPRALNEHQLQEYAQKYGLKGIAVASVDEALNMAKAEACKEDIIFVGGSAFVVAEVI